MNNSGLQCGSAGHAASVHRDLHWPEIIPDSRVHVRYMAVTRGKAEKFALSLEQPGKVSARQPRRRFDEGIEHALQIERGAADHFEHVGGGGLLLQGFAQLVEQTRVLGGDDGLRGKVLDKLDLLVAEGA